MSEFSSSDITHGTDTKGRVNRVAGKRRFTPIQTDRVLLAIIARGLLSQRELRVCAWVWSDSWGFNRQTTRPHVTAAHISRSIDLSESHSRNTLQSLIARLVIAKHTDGSLEFNEHFSTWKNDPKEVASTDPNRVGQNDPNRVANKQAKRPLLEKRPTQIGSVSDPNRVAPYICSNQPLKEPTEERVGVAQKTRAPTAVESAFILGFKTKYGHDPSISKEHAKVLAIKVRDYGQKLVIDKINAWWTSAAGNWIKDARDLGAFLRCFDRIIVGSESGAPGSDPERDSILESL